jgi:MarR family transcriptional regulator, organic hydroperoxide resistance regulator
MVVHDAGYRHAHQVVYRGSRGWRRGCSGGGVPTSTPTIWCVCTKVATRMTEAGLLMRRRDDRDNRFVRLWLTDAGRALQEPIEEERRLMEEKLTADLTETEREHLMKALAKIHRSASNLLGSPIDHGDPAITWAEER